MNKVPIAFVAKMLNTTISKAQRKFGGKGHIDWKTSSNGSKDIPTTSTIGTGSR